MRTPGQSRNGGFHRDPQKIINIRLKIWKMVFVNIYYNENNIDGRTRSEAQ